MFYPYYFDRTMILVLIGMVVVGFAQWRVNHAYKKNQQIQTHRGETGSQIARRLLDQAGLQSIPIEVVGGKMSDHYDPRKHVLRLSAEVAGRATVASVGIAAHEVGHAIQHANGYAPLTVRDAIVPVVNVASQLAIPLLFVGFLLERGGLVTAALILYASVVVFQLITLPVEFNASNRAKALIAQSGGYTEEEQRGVSAVLSAAAMTYLASTFMALLQFLRLFLLTRNRD
ncbi:MAG: zinc metallopeptidase [Christensenellales bacterium]|jgi:Zn-dependent membrane protease YugP